MRIAYVEDNATNLSLVQRIASMNHHTVIPYSEGEVALRELSIQKVDLILMDIELAGEMNGLQVVRALRTRGLTTPIVAVTAYAMMGDRERCLEAGCNDYLPKPLPIAEFLVLLARYDDALRADTGPAVPPIPAATAKTATGVSPAVSIIEPHADPVEANAQSLPIRTDTAPLRNPPASGSIKSGVGSPTVRPYTNKPGPSSQVLKTPAPPPPEPTVPPVAPLAPLAPAASPTEAAPESLAETPTTPKSNGSP